MSLKPAIPPPPAGLAATSGPALWVQPETPPDKTRRWQIYAYSFWRNGGGAPPLGPAQYGGGQSGAIATYDVSPRLSLLLRGALAHDISREREIAAGLRWSPPHFPDFTLTAERRFRHAWSDAFAVYAAGGKSGLPLPLQFELDAYGQTGYVSGRGGGPFFDAQARASRETILLGDATFKLGGGVWAGGQKGVARLDIGPSIGSEIEVGQATIHIDVDWRFRIAGDAAPASGPALTLSTSF